MFKLYLKQAWQLIKQNKLFSTVYIICTGLAIALTMTLAIVYYVKIAPQYPEGNRNRTLVIKYMGVSFGKNRNNSYKVGYPMLRDYLYTLQTPETVSGSFPLEDTNDQIEHPESGKNIPVSVRAVDPPFWEVFTYRFLNGKPFSQEEFDSGIRSAVISSSLAQNLFGTENAEGRRFKLNADEYRISGVVRSSSYAAPDSYADVFIPYTLYPGELSMNSSFRDGMLGPMDVYFVAPSVGEINKVKNEVNDIFRKISSSQDEFTISPFDYPEPYWQHILRVNPITGFDWLEFMKTFGVVLLALLIIPALNLAGMVSSRMEKRLPEMGIRKAFGASKGTLYRQILTENFLLTMLGGLVGLILSYIIILTSSGWILTLFDKWPDSGAFGSTVTITPSMLFNPWVFVITFLVCFILNFVSAITPAANGLKKNIIYSLNEKS